MLHGELEDLLERVDGVLPADGVALAPRTRSCGHVIVAFCSAIACDCRLSGSTAATSAPWRYFSMRRMETRDLGRTVRYSKVSMRDHEGAPGAC